LRVFASLLGFLSDKENLGGNKIYFWIFELWGVGDITVQRYMEGSGLH
jgi:hypothetical protein